MYDAGYRRIVNIDVRMQCSSHLNSVDPQHIHCASARADEQYSKAVIEQMAARHTSRPEMTWLEMDIFDLQFGEEFDLVIDKGTSACTGR